MLNDIDFLTFVGAFKESGHIDSFSSEGYRALYKHLCDIENDTGTNILLDPVEIDSQFTEYLCVKDFIEKEDKSLKPYFKDLLWEHEDFDDASESFLDMLEREKIIIRMRHHSFIVGE